MKTATNIAKRASRYWFSPYARAWIVTHESLVFALISASWVSLLYRNAIYGLFVYDDVDQIQKNASIQGLYATLQYFHSAQQFTASFRGFGGSFYRPLFWFSLALDQKAWGLNPIGFHITNIVLHWTAGLLGFLLLRRSCVTVFVSAISSLVWLGLPINSEVVAWISGRGYSLMFLSLLLALLSSVSYLRSRTNLSLFLYSLAALASVLCHEEGVLVLPMTLLLLYSIDRFRSHRVYLLLGTTGLSVVVAYFCLRRVAGTQVSTGGAAEFLAAGAYFVRYLTWMTVPIHMSIERSSDVPANSLSILTISSSIGITILGYFAHRIRQQMPEVAAGIVWMFIALLPFCGIVSLYQGMAERFDYVASAGLCLSIATLLSRLRTKRVVALCILAIWVIWGAWRTEERVLDYHDPISLYKASLQATPGSTALLFDLGAAFEQKGDLVHATTYYQHTLDIDPHYERAIAGIANIYLRLGATTQAMRTFERALTLNPNDASALINYGGALLQSGDSIRAEQAEERAISINPSNANAYCILGVALFQLGSTDAAVAQLNHAIELDPSRTDAYFDLAIIYKQLGRIEGAVAMYRRIIEVEPNNREATSALDDIAIK